MKKTTGTSSVTAGMWRPWCVAPEVARKKYAGDERISDKLPLSSTVQPMTPTISNVCLARELISLHECIGGRGTCDTHTHTLTHTHTHTHAHAHARTRARTHTHLGVERLGISFRKAVVRFVVHYPVLRHHAKIMDRNFTVGIRAVLRNRSLGLHVWQKERYTQHREASKRDLHRGQRQHGHRPDPSTSCRGGNSAAMCGSRARVACGQGSPCQRPTSLRCVCVCV